MMSDSYKISAVLSADVGSYVQGMKSAQETTETFKKSADSVKDIKLGADASSLTGALSDAKAGLAAIPESRQIILNAIDNAGSIVDSLKSSLDSYAQPISTELDANGQPAEDAIGDVHSRLMALESEKIDPILGLQDQASDKIAEAKGRLDEFSNENAKASVGVNDNASDHLVKIELLLERLEETVTAVVNLQDNATKGLEGIERGLEQISQPHNVPVNLTGDAKRQLGELQNEGKKAGGLWDTLKGSMVFTAGQHIFDKIAEGIPEFIGGIQSSAVATDNLNTVLQYYNRTVGATKTNAQGLTAQQERDMADIKEYAAQTIYSTVDMDQAYAQLVGTGVDGAGKIVEAFGNIAAASTDPQQAMTTIMTQMTQMAANGKADWADMKLVFEQAGTIEPQVARNLGMSVSEMHDAMSKGKISAQDMLDAVAKAANDGNGILKQAATTFHTIPQAVDGLKEDLEQQLQPAFESVSHVGIAAITGVSNAIDNSGLGESFSKMGEAFTSFTDGIAKSGAGKTLEADLTGALSNVAKFNNYLSNSSAAKSFGEVVGQAINSVSRGFQDLNTIVGGTVGIINQTFGDVSMLASDGFSVLQAATGTAGNEFDNFSKQIGQLKTIQDVKKWFSDVGTSLQESFGTGMQNQQKAWDELTKTLTDSDFVKDVKKNFHDAKQSVSDFFDSIGKSKQAQDLKKNFEEMEKPIDEFKKSIEQSDAFKSFKADLEGTKKRMEEAKKSFENQQWVKDLKTAFDDAKKDVDDFNQKLSQNPAVKKFQDDMGKVGDHVKDLGSHFSGLGSNGAMAFVDIGAAVLTTVGGFALAKTAVGKIKEKFDILGNLNPFKNLGEKTDKGMDEAQQSSQKGGNIITRIFKTIGDSVGNVISGIGHGVAGAFKAFAAVPVSGLIKGAAAIGIFELALAGLGAMRGLIHPLFQDLIDGVTQLITTCGSQLPNLGTLFKDCGSAIKDAFDGVGDIIKGALDGVADIIESTGEAAEKSGEGFKKMADGASVLGKVDFKTLSANLASLMSFGVVQGGQGFLAAIGDKIGLTNGKNTLATLAENLDDLGKACDKLSTKKLDAVVSSLQSVQRIGTAKIDPKGLSSITDTLKDVQKLGSAKINTKGLSSIVQTLKQAQQLGTAKINTKGLTGITGALKEVERLGTARINTRGLSSIVQALRQVQQLGTAKINTKGLTGITGALKEVERLGTAKINTKGLSSIVQALKQVQQLGTAKINTKGLSSITSALQNVQKVASAKINTKGLSGLVSALRQMQQLGSAKINTKGLSSLVSAMRQVQKLGTAKINTKGLSGLVSSLRQLQSVAGKGTSAGVSTLATSLTKLSSAGRVASAAMQRVGTIIRSSMTQAASAVRTAGNQMSAGFSSSAHRVVSSANSMASGVRSAIASASNGAYGSGQAIGAGLANGMDSMLGRVQAAAARIASAAESAVREAAKIHSPSRVHYDLGRFIGQGLANGILAMKSEVESNAESLLDFSYTVGPSVSMPTPTAGSSDRALNLELHSDVYLDGQRMGYALARPVKDKTERDAKLSNLLMGLR